VESAWWTGPVVAANADTLPPGHVYVEPYLFDVITRTSRTPGSLSYVLYGVAPGFTAGVLPSFSYAKDAAGKRDLRMGDVVLNFQYRLKSSGPGKRSPSLALVLQQKLPTAKYDQLDGAGSGAGSGTHSTMVGLYGQQFFWLPNGRIVRARFNVTHTFEGIADVKDISVYGTPEGFRGTARPGDSTMFDLAAEYSVTKQFVVAMDVLRQWNGPTVVKSSDEERIRPLSSPASSFFAVVPAVEYNWSPRDGVILGVRRIFKGHNSGPSVTPVVAYSRFF